MYTHVTAPPHTYTRRGLILLGVLSVAVALITGVDQLPAPPGPKGGRPVLPRPPRLPDEGGPAQTGGPHQRRHAARRRDIQST